jgi:hypothetical protein
LLLGSTALAAASALGSATSIQPAQAQQAARQKPNILFIMGDDVGWFNIGAYHQGFERTPSVHGETLNNSGGGYLNDFLAREFWRFVQVQEKVTDLARTAIEFPPMQAPASFNLSAVKEKIDAAMKTHEGQ